MRKKLLKKLVGLSMSAMMMAGIIPTGNLVKNNYCSEAAEVEIDCVMVESAGGYYGDMKFYNTGILRRKIEKISLHSYRTNTEDSLGSKDISNNQNGSVMAWWTDKDEDGYYEMNIGQDGGVIANKDASKMFSVIGVEKAESDILEGIENLNTDNMMSASYMFWDFGEKTVSKIDLGENFDTSNVVNMAFMFCGCGMDELTELNLGKKFDTSKVYNMKCMFAGCGGKKLTSINLGDKFYTENVSDMSGMFTNEIALANLDLGENFDLSNLTNMTTMFYNSNYIENIDLRNIKYDGVEKIISQLMIDGITIYTSDAQTYNYIEEYIGNIDSNKYKKIPVVKFGTLAPKELAANLTVNKSIENVELKTGDKVNLEVTAEGGSDEYTYQYVMKNMKTGADIILKDYSSSNTYSGPMVSEGIKEFRVNVKDSEDTIVTTNIVVVIVTKQLTATLKANNSAGEISLSTGESVKLVAAASGGSGNYTYQYVLRNAKTGSELILKDYCSSNIYTGPLVSAGIKQFYVNVKDTDGNIVTTNTVTTVVSRGEALAVNLKVNDCTDKITINVGETVNLSVTATGGAPGYIYQYTMKNVKTGATYILKNYSSSATYTGPITSAGTKEFTVKVKDTAGNILSSNTVTVIAVSK